jgi:hypothetical protein
MRDFLGIVSSIIRIRTARASLIKLATKRPGRKGSKVSKDPLQKRIDAVKERKLNEKAAEQRGVIRREFLSLSLRTLGVLSVAPPAVYATMRWASSSDLESGIPSLDPRSETIRRILFGPEEIDSAALERILWSQETGLTLHQFRSLVEAAFEREARALINYNENFTMNIFGERILITEPFAIRRANQALRRIGSNKRIWFGVAFQGEHIQLIVVFGQIEREERFENSNKYLIVFSHEGVVSSPNLPLATSDLSTTGLFESSLWASIEAYFTDREHGSEKIRLFASELFRCYGISSYQELQDRRDKLLQDFAEFVLAHERGHFETISRVGGFHAGFGSALTRPGIVPTNRPINYNFVINEFLADLAGLQHITSLAQNDPVRGKRLILFYLMLAIESFEGVSDANLEHAVYRSMGFAIAQCAIRRSPEDGIEIDFNRLDRSISQARRLTETDLREKTQDFKNQLSLKGYGNKLREIEHRIKVGLSQSGFSQKQLEIFISQRLFLSLLEDQDFLLFNSSWQNNSLIRFEKAFMANPDLVGPIAGRYEYPLEFSNAPVDEWLH